MERKPVVLITVRGGVVQHVSAPGSVNTVVHDYDSITEGSGFECVWCGKSNTNEEMTGRHGDICPHCNNPTVTMQLFDLQPGDQFLCLNGGKWEKVSETEAKCLEDDSAFKVGDIVTFAQHADVFPY